MAEDIINDGKNPEINLNLKIPPEDIDGGLTFKSIVQTVYNARKTFLLWICIGVLLGAAAAVMIYLTQGGAPPAVTDAADQDTDQAAVSIILNYNKYSRRMFPDGEGFEESSFYQAELWERALAAIGRADISVADAMSAVSIVNAGTSINTDILADILENLPDAIPANIIPTIANNYINNRFEIEEKTYLLSIPAGSSLFEDPDEETQFLQALCNEYDDFIRGRYYNDEMLGKLYAQYLRNWTDLTDEAIIWNQFDYNANFRLLGGRYSAMIDVLEMVINYDPLYTSKEGKTFADYADELRSLIYGDIAAWADRSDSEVSVRNIDRFMAEFDDIIALRQAGHQYQLDLLTYYNELLYSYRQASTDWRGQDYSLELFRLVQDAAVTAADLQKEINRMQYHYEALLADEGAIRARSREAETALMGFIGDLEDKQAQLYDVLYEYYKELNARDAQNAILISTLPAGTGGSGEPAGGGLGRVLMMAVAFAACVALGIFMAFFVVAVKKHLPEKGTVSIDA